MDNSMYLNYLTLLDEISALLEQLCGLARKKTDAVRADDLITLDQVLRQEQALSLSVRGMEMKRTVQLRVLGLEGTRLSALADACPPELQPRARQTAERLREQYQLYQGVSEVARNTLECNLHEIEKILAGLGSAPAGGPGYSAPQAEPPRAMKTDFRA